MSKTYKIITTTVDAVKGDISLLDGEELKRYKRFISDIKKEEFLTARTFLKHALAKELKVAPKQISLSYSDNGKPFLSKIYGDFHFNLSHSNGYIVLATSNHEIGVDLEPISALDEEKLKWFLSDQELKEVKSIKDASQRKFALFQLFTMKEAFIKATDKSFLLDTFTFWYINNQWELQIEGENNWKFDIKTIGNELVVAICYK
ncbi:4'-phosphopantetheinyl transferase family protein [Flammeovirga aprica]|uniref:4'-phosphopantetheinyl transferase superfamily protein n=1 Tax=Flammeovirga aprica JL-4 TaxID=694437 RepID=A0A7X9RR51_9BACT|nr:4'-phosphopantetheinyl transferase superfamily protein [Flammeovirga aprica]NME67473.1 4'-phosphopantetheinyl transferase superfamily protein [Flammeovirga aprica JL-4]